MYRRPKFLEILLDIRCQMAREADYDVDLFTEMVRSGDILRERRLESNGHRDIAKVEPHNARQRRRNTGEN